MILYDEISFQNYGLIENMNVIQNIEIGIAFKKRKVASMSGGEQQRIALIRLLLKNPKLILVDEPTGSLDKTNGEVIVSQLMHIVRSGKTLIMATHDMEIAKQCDEMIDISQYK